MSANELLNWHILAAALSGVFAVWSVYPYVRDILREGGETKPNAVSFFLWTVCELIALTAQIKAGWSWSIVIMGFFVFNTTLIFVLSVIGYGYRRYRWLDLGSFLCSVLAIALWQTTDSPSLAIVFSIVADICAAVPTLRKIVEEPRSENFIGWVLILIATFFGILSTEKMDLPNLAFPVYVFLINGLVVWMIYSGRKRALEKRYRPSA